MIRESIRKLVEGGNLSYEEARKAMMEIMSGKTSDAQIAAFLITLKIKGETIDEIAAFAAAMRMFCNRIHPKVRGRLIDTCGTGGDRVKTFNVSTLAAFIIAGAEVSVAKHGNRSVTSLCGSADVLESLGLNLQTEPHLVEKIIEKVGIGFMFAPTFHPAMRYAGTPRRDIGVRTVFNILGPLTNPANADAQLIGVYDETLVKPLALVLKKLGCKEAMVVHGLDGVDEISITGKTVGAWLKEDNVSLFDIDPESLGLKRARIEAIEGSTAEYSVELSYKMLNDFYSGPKKDMVLINAAAGLIVGGKATDFNEGLELARFSLEDGSAYKKLRQLIKECGDLTVLERLESEYD